MKQNQEEQTSMEAAEPDDADGVSPGEQLKAARLTLGMSLNDVSSRLKLPIKKIESLESDDVDGVASPVFVAGYLRTYARLLELPEDEVLAGFAKLPAMKSPADDGASEDAVHETMAPNSKGKTLAGMSSPSAGTNIRQSRSLAMLALIVLLVSAAVYFSLQNSSETMEETQTEPVTNIAPEWSAEPETNTEPESAQSSSEIDSQESAVIESSHPEPMTSIEAVPSPLELMTTIEATDRVATDETSPADESAQKAATTAVFSQSELRLVFNDDSWVDVEDARGNKLVYRLAKAGLSRTVTGVAPFDVQLGYAPAVEIFYNGQPYDMSRYAGRRSARFRVGHAGDRMTNE